MSHSTLPVQTFLRPGQISLPALPPMSLYVHFPWCVRKCPYCDFNSHEWRGDGGAQAFPEQAYLDALRQDLEQALPLVWGRPVHTVFIGGGTPSLLSAAGLDRLLSDLRALLPLDADAEIAMEANPGTFEADKFRSFRASGVNRLSIGIQSFNSEHLKALGRIHDGDEARHAIEIAQANFENFNLDLMFALPNQTLAQCQQDVETALSFAPPHLSLYHLTMEPNTVFAKFPPEDLPDDDTSAAMQDAVEAELAAAGLARYEVSAYARPGARCRHNLNYWEFGDYLGLGPGAHGKLSFHDRIVREARLRSPDSWMRAAAARDGSHLAESRQVGPDELPFEFMLNALRLKDGVAATLFNERTGLSLAAIAHQLEAAADKGLLDADPTRLRATPLGWRFLNDLQEMFL